MESTIRTAVERPLPLPKSNASAGLLAQIGVSTSVDHMPLNRQEAFYKRHGTSLPRAAVQGCWAHFPIYSAKMACFAQNLSKYLMPKSIHVKSFFNSLLRRNIHGQNKYICVIALYRRIRIAQAPGQNRGYA